MPWHERRNDACFFLCHWCSLGDSLQPGHGCRHLCIPHTGQAASGQGLLSLKEPRSPLPCPAQLHIHCAWEIHSYCNWGNEDWENTLHWTQPGSVFVVQTLHLWVATDCLQLRGELLLKYPDTVEQYQAWNRDGVLLISALQERVRHVESKEKEGYTLCFSWILHERCSYIYFFHAMPLCEAP